LCAVLALVMAASGVYAVISDLVARRSRELALRMALGAGAWAIVGNIIREGLRLGAIGGSAGFALAIVGTPFVDRFVVHPQLPGLVVLLGATVSLGLLVTTASALPAWRAVSVDPRIVMHDE